MWSERRGTGEGENWGAGRDELWVQGKREGRPAQGKELGNWEEDPSSIARHAGGANSDDNAVKAWNG